MARSFNTLGNVAYQQGDYPTARSLYEQSLALFRELGDKRGHGSVLQQPGDMWPISQGDYPTARSLYEQSLALRRELGDKRGIASSLLNLGMWPTSRETTRQPALYTSRAWPYSRS